MARWEWVRWVNATKNPDTRGRRVEVSISKMESGKRRPCCFDLSSCTDPDLSKSGKLLEPGGDRRPATPPRSSRRPAGGTPARCRPDRKPAVTSAPKDEDRPDPGDVDLGVVREAVAHAGDLLAFADPAQAAAPAGAVGRGPGVGSRPVSTVPICWMTASMSATVSTRSSAPSARPAWCRWSARGRRGPRPGPGRPAGGLPPGRGSA